IFAVNSLVSISSPEMSYTKIPNSNRIDGSVDFTNLEFYSSLEDIESLTINDEFIIRCQISPSLGESITVRVRLIPKEVELIEGFQIKKSYEISSGFVGGPKKNYNMITRVPLSTLNLAPGTYKVEITYNVLTGFAYRSAPSDTFEVFIGKDNLKVLSNERFSEPIESGYEYGAVYGFEYDINGTKSWNIVYDGHIVDSLHNPVQLDNLILYIEENDRYVQIANVTTDNEGKFYVNHTVYGSIEMNLMTKIFYDGNLDSFYNTLSHEEYAGLETDIFGNRFFVDQDRDGYPDWPYDLYDLLHVLSSQSQSLPSTSLAFMAEFDENIGINVYSFINNYQGIIQGGTTWDIGKRKYGLYFDGDGDVIGGGGESVGTTIYNAYANISYEYDTGGESNNTGWLSPQIITTVGGSGADWTTPNNAGAQNDSYASSSLTVGGGGGSTDYLIVPSTFTDVFSKWSTESNAYDWNNGTSATEDQGRIINDINWHGFNTPSSDTISSVDISLYLTLNGLSNDYLDIDIYVDGTQSLKTYRINSGNDGIGLYINLNDVDEPNDDSWSWAEVGNIEVRLDGTKAGSHDSVQDYEVYEVWGMVHTSGGGGSNAESDWLRATDFNANIAPGSNITGIEVGIDKYATVSSIIDYDIRLRRASEQVGDNKSLGNFWSTSDIDAYSTYGGAGDTWNAGLSVSDITSSNFGVDFAAITSGSNSNASVDHIRVKIYFDNPSTQIQNNSINRPNADLLNQWEDSLTESHSNLINETTLNASRYVYTSSIASVNITDTYSMGTFNINGGNVTQIQVKVYGKEIDIESIINVSAGSWSGLLPLDMATTPAWNVYIWPGLRLSQSDLDGMIVLFESEPPQSVQQAYENFDYVDFDDILDNSLGTSDSEFMITAWIYPTQFASNTSINGVKNVFFSKTGIIELGVNETGILQVHILTNNKNITAEYGFPGAITLNSWNFVAVRYNNSGNDVDILINDVWCREPIGGPPEPWDTGGFLEEGGKLIIGAEISTYSCFTGKLDDISVFNATLTDLEIESHRGGPFLAIDTTVLKEDGQGGWMPITIPGEVIEGRLKFDVNSTGKPINALEFYLSSTEPDLQSPNPNDWNLLPYTYTRPQEIGFEELYWLDEDSWNLPNSSSWYFVSKATDDIGNVVYDYYSTYFGVDHFDELINFTVKDMNGRIGVGQDYDHIGVSSNYESHINSFDIYINESDDIDLLTTINYTDIDDVIYLSQSLSTWITSKSLTPDNYNINFIIVANLTYDGFPFYLYNYTLEQTILDIKAPDIELLSGSPYSLVLGKTYDNVQQNLVTMAINSTESDFSRVKVEYKYETPTTSDWISYNTFFAVNSLANITLNLLNLRDDNLTLRFYSYDDLQNENLLFNTSHWLVKDLNNREQFTVEGLDNTILYGLDQNGMIDIDLKVFPFDNDITKVMVSTNYESFSLTTVFSEQNHIYFTDDDVIDLIQLNASFYNIEGSEFTIITIGIKLFQGSNIVPITSQEIVITATRATFDNMVEISNLTVDISSEINNILMSFVDNSAYMNPHKLPFIVNNLPPVLKVFDSSGKLVETIELQVDYDYFDNINYTDEQNDYSTKSPTTTANVDRNGAGMSDSQIQSAISTLNVNRNLGGGGSYATSWYSPFSATTIDYGSSIDWADFNNALDQNDSYTSSYLITTGGSGQHSMPVENDFNESVTFGDLEDIDDFNTTINSQFTPGGGSGDYLIIPSTFTDVFTKWSTESNAYDWDNATAATEDQGRIINDINWHGFNTPSSDTILNVNISLYLTLNGLSNDYLDIDIYVGTEFAISYRIDSGNEGTDLYINFNNINEPNDGTWSWAEVGNIEVRLDGTKAGSHDSVQDYEVYEVWGMVHTSGGGSPDSNDIDVEVESVLDKANGNPIEGSQEEEQIVDHLKIKKLYNKSIKTLSGGELQKVAVASCLLQKVDLYALDEPSAFLDVEDRIVVAKFIQKFVRSYGKSAIVIDHDLQLMDLVSDTMIIFEGTSGIEGHATSPLSKSEAMNRFLKSLDMSFRRDERSLRPRVNKVDSRLDKQQKESGNFYYKK
ncbi:hypothetical protein LCGC14_1135380, partial [marine sediment metagenome]